ncbi:MAG: hypothetical protein PHC64_08205, partial [Candidatus Gastranaerophilales bacterium]|nr:hypothetical protein [Candidatus Gastranaerophilales bacterium]
DIQKVSQSLNNLAQEIPTHPQSSFETPANTLYQSNPFANEGYVPNIPETQSYGAEQLSNSPFIQNTEQTSPQMVASSPSVNPFIQNSEQNSPQIVASQQSANPYISSPILSQPSPNNPQFAYNPFGSGLPMNNYLGIDPLVYEQMMKIGSNDFMDQDLMGSNVGLA